MQSQGESWGLLRNAISIGWESLRWRSRESHLACWHSCCPVSDGDSYSRLDEFPSVQGLNPPGFHGIWLIVSSLNTKNRPPRLMQIIVWQIYISVFHWKLSFSISDYCLYYVGKSLGVNFAKFSMPEAKPKSQFCDWRQWPCSNDFGNKETNWFGFLKYVTQRIV